MGNLKDLVTPEGLRLDGRKSHEIRQLHTRFGTISDADGSAFIQLGNTKVVALVFGPHESSDRSSQSRINFDLSIASFAMPSLKSAKQTKSSRRIGFQSRKIERKSTEICSFLHSTFDLLLGETFGSLGKASEIDVMIEVLQSDGSLLSACLNAASAALVDAGIPMRDFVCACSVGYTSSPSSCLLIDPNGEEEDQFRIPSFTCAVLPRTQEIVSFTLSAGRLPFDKLHEALKLCVHGAAQIHKQLDKTLMNQLHHLVDKRKIAVSAKPIS